MFPASVTTFDAGGGDEPTDDGGFTDPASGEEDDVININGPSALPPPRTSLFSF